METFKTTISGQDLKVNTTLKGWQIYKRTSSFIAYIAVNIGDKKLFIQFQNGDCFIFYEVPEPTLEAAFKAASLGKFYHSEIKGKFTTTLEGDNWITIDTGDDEDDDDNVSDDEYAYLSI